MKPSARRRPNVPVAILPRVAARARAEAAAKALVPEMSSVEVERRPQPELEKFPRSFEVSAAPQVCCRCALRSEQQWPAEELEALSRRLLEERDESWRRHERAQIAFLQNQNSALLSALHAEIERLQNAHRELQRRMVVEGKCATEDEKQEALDKANARVAELTEALGQKEALVQTLRRQAEQQVAGFREKTKQQEDRIRQLTSELHEKTLTVTQLSTQLRQIRLREAMAQAQQRRRASVESPQRASPTAAFRLFAPPPRPRDQTQTVKVVPEGGASPVKATASVTVSYPQPPQPPQRPQFISATRGSSRSTPSPAAESTEKPIDRKSVV
uniref:CCDC92 domain-containing protein n=1 Tax=Steinernema glaseri TaxID=37863 RepID=A0A1I8A7U6_9BILA